jgi:hypothetical protein
MVLGEHHIKRMEGKRVAPVDPWQTYVHPTVDMPLPLMVFWCYRRFREKYTYVGNAPIIVFETLNILE